MPGVLRMMSDSGALLQPVHSRTELMGTAILAGLVTIAVFVAFITVVVPYLLQYRMTDRGIETLLAGRFVLDVMPWTYIGRAGDIRVATEGELIRTGEFLRSMRMGTRALLNRPAWTVVAIRHMGGDVYVISPRRPHSFVEEARTRHERAHAPSVGGEERITRETGRWTDVENDVALPVLPVLCFGLWVVTLLQLSLPEPGAEVRIGWVLLQVLLWPLMMVAYFVWRWRRSRAAGSPRRHG